MQKEIPSESEGYIKGHNGNNPTIFIMVPTMNLRILRMKNTDTSTIVRVERLQQQWVDNFSPHSEWRDVELIENCIF